MIIISSLLAKGGGRRHLGKGDQCYVAAVRPSNDQLWVAVAGLLIKISWLIRLEGLLKFVI